MLRIRPLLLRSILPLGASLLAACATLSSGVQPAGPDAFQITERDSPLNGGAATAQRDAVNAAEAFCASHNAAFMPGQAEALGRPVQEQLMGPTGFTLTFRCRDADAPPGPGFDDPPQD